MTKKKTVFAPFSQWCNDIVCILLTEVLYYITTIYIAGVGFYSAFFHNGVWSQPFLKIEFSL